VIVQSSFLLLLLAGTAMMTLPTPAHAHPGSGIVVDARGNVYFVVPGSNDIMRVDRSGQATKFVSDERLRLPHHLVLGRDGSLYAASDYDGRVWHIGADGSLREFFNSNRVGRAPGRPEVQVGSFGDPFTIDSAGNIYALAAPNVGAIIRITPEGTATPIAEHARFGALHFASMTWGGDGALYLSDANRVWRIANDSATALTPRGIQLSQATGIAIDASGGIHVADFREGRIVRFLRDGTVDTPPALARLRLRSPTGVTLAGADIYVLDAPPAGVAVWRVRDGKAERLYAKHSPQFYTRWALPLLLLLLLALFLVSIRRRRALEVDRQGSGGVLTGERR
jgi:sugar lactone lactonase YvrE